MIGILLISHGEFAQGMLASSHLFFGRDILQIEALCLMPEESPDTFGERLKNKISELNDGSGVVILCDLLFGTPCNQSASLLHEDVKVICGANMPLLLELLSQRNLQDENGQYLSLKNIDLNSLRAIGAEGVCNLEEKL